MPRLSVKPPMDDSNVRVVQEEVKSLWTRKYGSRIADQSKVPYLLPVTQPPSRRIPSPVEELLIRVFDE